MKNKEYKSLIPRIYSDHNNYYEECRPSFERYRDCYNIDFFRGNVRNRDTLDIQVADANSFVEGYIASLFSKAPAVRIGGDIKASQGDETAAEAVANRFLFDQQEVFTNAARLSLIYPMSFIKIVPTSEETDIMDQFTLLVLKPWEVIVDMTAPDWNSMRWVAHVSYVPLGIAKDMHGEKKYKPEAAKDYFTNLKNTGSIAEVPDDFLYVKIVEFYDLVNSKRIFWTPNLDTNDGILGIDEIPLKDVNDKPLAPIIPLYLCTAPEQPLKGFSTIKKIYDQIREKNLLRTHMAQAIRRDSRQLMYKDGVFDEESLAKLEAGLDNSFIPVKTSEDVRTLMAMVPTIPLSGNYPLHLQLVEQDLARASVMAPFSRGEATKATATEVSALAQYTAAEVGKMARQRDQAIERIVKIYLRLLQVFLDEDDTKTVLTIKGDLKTLTSKDLEGKFKIVAVDQLSSPEAQDKKKQEIVQMLPVLTQLGVSTETIRKEIASRFGWDFMNDVAAPPMPPQGVPLAGEGTDTGLPPGGIVEPSGAV